MVITIVSFAMVCRQIVAGRKNAAGSGASAIRDMHCAGQPIGWHVVITRKKKKESMVLWTIWSFLILALMRPQWWQNPLIKQIPGRDLLLVVDLSASMSQEDFTNAQGTTVDRLTAVKDVLGDFLERREGDRVGLVVFGDSPYLQTPFSTDLQLGRQLLNEVAIGMAGPKTAFGDAIGLGITLFQESGPPAKTIIALTYGNDTASQVPPIEAARVARQRAIRIHTVAIGNPATAGEDRLDEALLRSVVKEGGGSYFYAMDRERLAEIYQELDRIETHQIKTITHRPHNELFHWPLLTALFISLIHKSVVTFRQFRRPVKGHRSSRIRVGSRTGKLHLNEHV